MLLSCYFSSLLFRLLGIKAAHFVTFAASVDFLPGRGGGGGVTLDMGMFLRSYFFIKIESPSHITCIFVYMHHPTKNDVTSG